jgi:AcrR family transcriptional regulator
VGGGRARRGGLGTIYRQFPNREALYLAVIGERVRRLQAEARDLLDADDPGAAFFAFFTRVVEVSKRNKAVADVLADAGIDPKSGIGQHIDADMPRVIEELLTARSAPALSAATWACRSCGPCSARPAWRPNAISGTSSCGPGTLGMLFHGLRPHHWRCP